MYMRRIGDSDQIVKYIEEKYPEPKLGTPESTSDACAFGLCFVELT